MLRLVGKRLENKAKYFIGKTQFGIRRGCGSREAISAMRLLCERRLEFEEELLVCFVVFEKILIELNGKAFRSTQKYRSILERQKTYHEFINTTDSSR